eukprot:6159449-Alexandrium_andersonii.AAC.1
MRGPDRGEGRVQRCVANRSEEHRHHEGRLKHPVDGRAALPRARRRGGGPGGGPHCPSTALQLVRLRGDHSH